MGECHVRNVKVEGSNPFASTKTAQKAVLFTHLRQKRTAFLCESRVSQGDGDFDSPFSILCLMMGGGGSDTNGLMAPVPLPPPYRHSCQKTKFAPNLGSYGMSKAYYDIGVSIAYLHRRRELIGHYAKC